MEKGKRKTDLTVYLVKEEFVEGEEVVDSKKVQMRIPLKVGSDEIGPLYVANSHSNLPRWASFFDGVIDVSQLGRNQSTGALLIVKE